MMTLYRWRNPHRWPDWLDVVVLVGAALVIGFVLGALGWSETAAAGQLARSSNFYASRGDVVFAITIDVPEDR